jgi:hypothetical protein
MITERNEPDHDWTVEVDQALISRDVALSGHTVMKSADSENEEVGMARIPFGGEGETNDRTVHALDDEDLLRDEVTDVFFSMNEANTESEDKLFHTNAFESEEDANDVATNATDHRDLAHDMERREVINSDRDTIPEIDQDLISRDVALAMNTVTEKWS